MDEVVITRAKSIPRHAGLWRLGNYLMSNPWLALFVLDKLSVCILGAYSLQTYVYKVDCVDTTFLSLST